jgi:glycosyltransferase involved in cell wall biosynthesis
MQHNVHLTIVAAFENEEYWETCKSAIDKLPSQIAVKVMSDIEHEKLEDIIRDHHLFVLPTQGENFGHSIFESLAAGRPVLISDQTPWRDLENKKSGWDLSLRDPQKFKQKIEMVAEMDNEELTLWCKSAWSYARDFIQHSDLKQQYLKLFS